MHNTNFQWKCEPKAEKIILKALKESCLSNEFIHNLQNELLKQTNTRLLDWTDHVILGNSPALEAELEESGFISDLAGKDFRVFHHPGAQLPRIIVKDNDQPTVGVALSVESIEDFLLVRGMSGSIEGSHLGQYRRCCVSTDNGVSLWVVERRGSLTVEPTHEDNLYIKRYLDALQLWETRPRAMDNDSESFKITLATAENLAKNLGPDLAAWIVLEAERKYWQSRNTAGQIQKNRQDRLGMGWANHDHHTFRSSRKHFQHLVRLFEILGFHCRERFYAGKEAGWGAQVMENPTSKLILFLDVDLDPHELDIDFAHHSLPELKQLGTIGLWCELHGDSILKAGMHHLEAQFIHDELTQDLGEIGIKMMEPFSNFPYLKQAFTVGEIWSVEPRRIERLLALGRITPEQAARFSSQGAVGSHLENLQRNEGYKGFNQKNVSVIIKKTDPRNAEVSGPW